MTELKCLLHTPLFHQGLAIKIKKKYKYKSKDATQENNQINLTDNFLFDKIY